jgi:hypothetical protein
MARRQSTDNTDTQLEDVRRRLTDVEEMARANRRELELQFRRIAEMQVQIDSLLRRKKR